MKWFRKFNPTTEKEELGDVEFDDINFSSGVKIYEFDIELLSDGNAHTFDELINGNFIDIPPQSQFNFQMLSVAYDGILNQRLAYSGSGVITRDNSNNTALYAKSLGIDDSNMAGVTLDLLANNTNERLEVEITDASIGRTTKWKILIFGIMVTI